MRYIQLQRTRAKYYLRMTKGWSLIDVRMGERLTKGRRRGREEWARQRAHGALRWLGGSVKTRTYNGELPLFPILFLSQPCMCMQKFRFVALQIIQWVGGGYGGVFSLNTQSCSLVLVDIVRACLVIFCCCVSDGTRHIYRELWDWYLDITCRQMMGLVRFLQLQERHV